MQLVASGKLATIQCDFNLPERFDLSYINEKGEKERPVVIHRAISGSLERFMGVAIEHFAGNFPLWLSPEQVRVIPVAEAHHAYARDVYAEFKKAGTRATLDDANESLGKKIRSAKMGKLPYFIVIGDNEVNAGTVTLESRNGEKQTLSIADAVTKLSEEVKMRAR